MTDSKTEVLPKTLRYNSLLYVCFLSGGEICIGITIKITLFLVAQFLKTRIFMKLNSKAPDLPIFWNSSKRRDLFYIEYWFLRIFIQVHINFEFISYYKSYSSRNRNYVIKNIFCFKNVKHSQFMAVKSWVKQNSKQRAI